MDSTVKNYFITDAQTGSSKCVCSVIDLLLDDFVEIIKSQDLSVVSKVVKVTIDYTEISFMLWCKDGHVETFTQNYNLVKRGNRVLLCLIFTKCKECY